MTCDAYEPLDPYCPMCNSCMEVESCWQCFGEGGFHDCGEDCCCCLEPDINETCDVCNGAGDYLVCPRAGEPGHREGVK